MKRKSADRSPQGASRQIRDQVSLTTGFSSERLGPVVLTSELIQSATIQNKSSVDLSHANPS